MRVEIDGLAPNTIKMECDSFRDAFELVADLPHGGLCGSEIRIVDSKGNVHWSSNGCENCGSTHDVHNGLCDICCDRMQDDAGL